LCFFFCLVGSLFSGFFFFCFFSLYFFFFFFLFFFFLFIPSFRVSSFLRVCAFFSWSILDLSHWLCVFFFDPPFFGFSFCGSLPSHFFHFFISQKLEFCLLPPPKANPPPPPYKKFSPFLRSNFFFFFLFFKRLSSIRFFSTYVSFFLSHFLALPFSFLFWSSP